MDTTLLLAVAVVGGFYMAWNIGANDVANAFGTVVGSGSLTLRRAILLAAACEFCGAFFVGEPVAKTISDQIVQVSLFEREGWGRLLGAGMVASVLAAAVWMNIATFLSQPVSTTHAIVGAVMGFGLAVAGPACVRWGKMGVIAASWVVSPLLGAVLAFAIYRWGIQRLILASRHPVYRAIGMIPPATGALVAIVTFSIVYRGLPGLHLDLPLPGAMGLSLLAGGLVLGGSYLGLALRDRPPRARWTVALAGAALVAAAACAAIHWCLPAVKLRLSAPQTAVVAALAAALALAGPHLGHRLGRHRHGVLRAERYGLVERLFGNLQVATACYMSFAHGANDVANAIGPLAGAMEIVRAGRVVRDVAVPLWLLAFGGVGIVIGLATYGYKVMEAIGRKITEITPTRGFAAAFGTATSVLVFSKLGMPISTTFVIVGAVMGVGFARGFAALDLRVIRRIFASWLVTIPVSAVLCAILFWTIRLLWGI